MKLGYKDIKGVAGIVPTPATAAAGSWRTENSIAIVQWGLSA
jgi:hypothetical protein